MKHLLATTILFLSFFLAVAQNAIVSGFEVQTKRTLSQPISRFSLNKDSIFSQIGNVPDSTSLIPTFVLSVDDVSQVDSVFFTLGNSLGQNVITLSNSLSSLLSSGSIRVVDNTIYMVMPPYPYLRRFEASARIKDTFGNYSTEKIFIKN